MELIEKNGYPKMTVLGEPQLGKRGLYPNLSEKGAHKKVRKMMDVIAYCDGIRNIFEIAEKTNITAPEVLSIINLLTEHELIKLKPIPHDE